jgi:hypothetical protein
VRRVDPVPSRPASSTNGSLWSRSAVCLRRTVKILRCLGCDVAQRNSALRALSREDSVPGMSDRDLASVLESEPMLSYLSGLFARRFLDSNTNWKDNDLVDMLFLSCAAGHVDYVAAEKHTGSQLRQTQQALGWKQTVFSTLHDLVGALTDAGVKTASEREADTASGGEVVDRSRC